MTPTQAGAKPMRILALSIIAVLSVAVPPAFAEQGHNPPWYPSLQAFEHYDSGRSHVFSQAKFRGSFHRPNTVAEVRSADSAYPSGYNTSYLNENAAFIQGGSYGGVPNSIGPFVAKFDPQTLEPVWYKQLRNTLETQPQEWNYPGAMAIMNDGYIYVVSGYRIYKVDPEDGSLVGTPLVLPTMVNMRNNWPCTAPPTYDSTLTDNTVNTSYNGINALPDGTIVVKSLYRQAGCSKDGPQAVLGCDQATNVPQSVLITVNPHTMQKIDTLVLPHPAPARPTITRWRGVDYVYLVESVSTPVRYSVKNGLFTFDTSWQPPAVTNPGQQPGGSLIVLNEWIVGATNSVPATGALTVFAIHQDFATGQDEDSKYHSVQPFGDDPVAPVLKEAFKTASPKTLSCGPDNIPPVPLPSMFPGNQAISWADMSLEADPENGLFYGVETLARKVAAFRITKSGIENVWKKTQTTTEWATLIGQKQHRVWVGTDIPVDQIPGANTNNTVVWRDARTGRELARSGELPTNMTQGSAVQPGYDGSVFFPGQEGMLIKLTPAPVRHGNGGPQP
jgi:hypothetical protein